MACVFCDRIQNRLFVPTAFTMVARFEPLDPVTPGHMLFIPTYHVEHADEDYPALTSCMSAAAQYGADHSLQQWNLITSNGPAATQTIPHLHVHFIPRVAGDDLMLPWTGQHLERNGETENDH